MIVSSSYAEALASVDAQVNQDNERLSRIYRKLMKLDTASGSSSSTIVRNPYELMDLLYYLLSLAVPMSNHEDFKCTLDLISQTFIPKVPF